jgi:hypothetical protein
MNSCTFSLRLPPLRQLKFFCARRYVLAVKCL